MSGWGPGAATTLAAQRASTGDAQATVVGTVATLGSGRISRRWSIDGAHHVATSALADPVTAAQWSTTGSPDFSLTVGGRPTSSRSGWSLLGVSAGLASPDPARPAAGPAASLVFRYASDTTVGGVGLELDRTYTLHPGSAVIVVASSLLNRTPSAVGVAAYSLDELTSPARVRTEVDTYHGGSDWRDDYRVMSQPSGVFDDEGEVARFDDGSGAGWFLVSERRSGLMSRVGREASGRTWVGVDHARDAFDYGPLKTDAPGYNRQDNPAYPAPVRERTIRPGASLYLGRAYLGVYHGGAQQAAAAFSGEFVAHEAPAFARSVGLNAFHPWERGPGMSDLNLRHQVDAARALGVESFMLDDSWQGGAGGVSGDWNFDSARFPSAGPDGPDFVRYVHAAGLHLGLWMSPLAFNSSSHTYAAHPEWACAPTGDVSARLPDDTGLGLWDVTNPGFRSYLSGVIDRLIARYGVTEFKFDFMAWVDCAPHDYLDYEDAFVALVRSFQARHPDVTFELDETNDQRSWPFESAALGPSWFDNGHLHGSTAQAKILHDLWSAAPWLAPSSIGFGTYDATLQAPYTVDYLMPMSLLGHFTFWTDLTKLSAPDAAETRWWLTWYRLHRAALGGLAYEDTQADPLDGSSWTALQPWAGDRGYVFAFRQSSPQPTQVIRLQGLDPAQAYDLHNVRTGVDLGARSGAQLARGLTLTLPTAYSAMVIAVDPVAHSLPAARACTSRRAFIIHVHRHRGAHLQRVVVLLDGRRTAVITGRRLGIPIRLTGLPRGTFHVRLVVEARRRGQTVTRNEVRTYHTCRPASRRLPLAP